MINLEKFALRDAGPTSRASSIGAPWSVGEWSVATNGHILVRVARRADIPENDKAPDLSKPLAQAAHATDIAPIPNFTMPETKACRQCRGNKMMTECPDCSGQGYRTCPTCDHDKDCDDCDGTGQVRPQSGEPQEWCQECDGDGVDWKSPSGETRYVIIAKNTMIQLRYASWIMDLPRHKISLTHREPDNGRSIPFTFDGGDGLLMPLRYSPPREGVDIVLCELEPA